MTIYCFKEKTESCLAVAARIRDIAAEVLMQRDVCSLVLAGGSTPRFLYETLAAEPWRTQIEWSRMHVFFGDERCVSPLHADSNFKMAKEAMLDCLPIPDYQIHRICGENSAETEAVRYEKVIEAFFHKYGGVSSAMDITLLGLGSDGHTASLFPGEQALNSSGLVTAVDIPLFMKPAVRRISLTLKGLSMSNNIFFLIDGAEKEEITAAVFADTMGEYPAALVHAKTLSWYLSGMNCSRFV